MMNQYSALSQLLSSDQEQRPQQQQRFKRAVGIINSDGVDRTKDDIPLVTVFQASPLAFQLKDGNTLGVHELLTLKEEQKILSNVFHCRFGDENAGIDFRIGTLGSIEKFLQESHTRRVVHFSMHGQVGNLLVENAWGGGVLLSVNLLRQWLSQTEEPPLVVVLATCNSRSLGEVFVQAGSKHVICTVDDDTDVTSASAMEFSKVLYRNMLSGRSIGDAFEMAQSTTAALGYDRQFCLLPEKNVKSERSNDPHQVQIFAKNAALLAAPIPVAPPFLTKNRKDNMTYFTRMGAGSAAIRTNSKPYFANAGLKKRHSTSPSLSPNLVTPEASPRVDSLLSRTPPTNNLSRKIYPYSDINLGEVDWLQRSYLHPKPPKDFVRCDVEMYRIIRAVSVARIVWVTGAKGCGKATVVQASCAYLQDRMAFNELDGILWSQVFEKGPSSCGGIKGDCCSLLDTILRIPSRKFLIVIDAKHLPDKTGQGVAELLDRTVKERPLVKILVIHRADDSRKLQIGNFPCVEHKIAVNKLNFEGTVKLFAKCSPHVFNHTSKGVHSPDSLWEIMEPPSIVDGNIYRCHRIEYDGRDRNGAYTYTATTSSMVYESPKRHEVILKKLGEGFPHKVMSVAKDMNEDDYNKIVFLGKYVELDRRDYQFHNGLLGLQLVLSRDIVKSMRRNMCCPSTSLLQMKFDCISMVKQEIQDLRSLMDDLDGIQSMMRSAKASRDWEMVRNLWTQRQGVVQRLQEEVDVFCKPPTPYAKLNHEILEMCLNKQGIAEIVLRQIQEVLAEALTHPNHCFRDSASTDSMGRRSKVHSMERNARAVDSMGRANTVDAMLGRAEEMLKLAISETLPTALVRLQACIRRYLAKQRLARERAGLALSTIQQGTRLLVTGRPSPPARSTRKNLRSILSVFFGPAWRRRGKDHDPFQPADIPSFGSFQPADIPTLTKHETTHLRLLHARNRPDERVYRIKKAFDYPRRESLDEEKRLSTDTGACDTTQTSVIPSVSTSTRPQDIFCPKTAEIEGEARWSSPLISKSPSELSLSMSRHSRRSSISTIGPYHLSHSYSSSSLDTSRGMSAATLHSSGRASPIRFIESQSSIDSTFSFWSVGTHDNLNVDDDKGCYGRRHVAANSGQHDATPKSSARTDSKNAPGTTSLWWDQNEHREFGRLPTEISDTTFVWWKLRNEESVEKDLP